MRFLVMFIKNKEAKNASWLIGGRIAQMLISLIVGILTARYLGPSNYGIVNYGAAYVAFFSSLSNLGINSVIIKNFVDHPNEQGETIGTTLLLRLVSGIISCVIIWGIVVIADAGEVTTIVVVVLCSLSLVFHIFETLNFWFQSQYRSKIVAIATLIAYAVSAIYRIILLITNRDVCWFAFSTSVDYIIYAMVMLLFYRKYHGPKLSFSVVKAKQLLGVSYHYILSGLMVAIYGYTDKIMLKQMMNEANVGYYSTATAICGMWVFVLQAVIDSMYPTILNLYKTSRESFERKNRQLYAVVFYASIFVGICFTLFGGVAVKVMYGESYTPAVKPLQIITWYTAFSYLGVARNAWIVCENKQHYLKYMYFSAAIINVGLNYVLIPSMGASGAALASLITQICTSIILPLVFKGMRRNSILMVQAICFKSVFGERKTR